MLYDIWAHADGLHISVAKMSNNEEPLEDNAETLHIRKLVSAV